MSAGFDVAGVAGALARIGEPEEVSNLVVCLASDESSSRPDLSSLSMGQLASTGTLNEVG
jgi:hypothetical protein